MTNKLENKWEIIGKSEVPLSKLKTKDVIDVLLVNRGIKNKNERHEFFRPKRPEKFTLSEVGLKRASVANAISRIKRAKKNGEKIVVYGDYDADGITATAILWETLYELEFDVIPFIPDRFSDGYGLKAKSIKKIKTKNPNVKLIITVDNGVVASDAVDTCNKLGIDVIITDHHEPGEKYPKAYEIVHSRKIGGAGVSWFLTREIRKEFGLKKVVGLDLAAVGTVSDQVPLFEVNRSIVKYGLESLNLKPRLGLEEIYKEARVNVGEIDTHTIGFVIGPRLNAMGRLEHAIDSLRLLCTKNRSRARELAVYLSKTNKRRQEIVEKVVSHAKDSARKGNTEGIIVISHETYHEGVVGLVASKLVDEFYRPAIVFSKGEVESKASARSIEGFNIIETIRKLNDLLITAGGHPMAAGVTIKTKDLDGFEKEINKVAKRKLTEELLLPKIKVDVEVNFNVLNWNLISELVNFAPTGSGNRTPVFATKKVKPWEIRTVGKENKHLKLKVAKGGKTIDAIGFGLGYLASSIEEDYPIDIVYHFEENVFNGAKSLQLRVRDIRL